VKLLPRNRGLRAIVIFLIGVAAIEALYLIVANVALAVIAKRFADREPVGVAFDRGLTWFPGRIHLRGVHVKGKTWSVAMSDADVVTTFTRIDSVTADVISVDIDEKEQRRSKGAIHVVVSDIVLDDQRVAFHADTKVDDATLEHGAVVLASGVHGTITLKVASVDLARQSILDTASGKVSLDGVFLSLEPLASFASLTTTQDRGTLHVAGTLDAGRVQSPSEIRAHTTHATLKDARGASADFPRGLDVVVQLMPDAEDAELELAVQTPSLVFGSADPSKPADVFDDFELTVPAGDPDLKTNHLVMRSLTWTSQHARVHEGATTLAASARGTLHFEIGKGDELAADTGTITATNVTVENPDAPDRAPFDAHLKIDRLAISRAEGIFLRGPLHASGDDVRPLLEVLVTSPSIRQTFSSFHQPFTLDTTMRRSNKKLALDDFTLHSAKVTLRGGYHRDDATSAGAFLLEDGVLPVGIVMHDKTESLVQGATSSWLTRELSK
jgi:hypothetical protein